MQLFNYEHKKCYSNEIIEIDRSSEERPTLRNIISRELDPGLVRFVQPVYGKISGISELQMQSQMRSEILVFSNL